MAQNKPLVLLTGASSGLGLALAKLLIKTNEFRLILTARESSLERFAQNEIFESDTIKLRELDVTNSTQRFNLVQECESKYGGVDVLINNAGVSMRSVVEDASTNDRTELLDINYISPMRLIAAVLPGMRRKRSGKIINVSSAAGLVGMPTMACYCGSKFALEGGTESLWYEVHPWNIKVTLVIPGFIKSNSFLNTVLTNSSQRALDSSGLDPYYYHYKNMERLIDWVMKRTWATPESIAVKILKVIKDENPSLRVPVTWDAWALYFCRRFLPRAIYHGTIYKFLPNVKIWGRIKYLKKHKPVAIKN